MFGKNFYRYPKVILLISAVKDMWISYLFQGIVLLRWQSWLPSEDQIMLISAVPFLTVILLFERLDIWYKLYDIACHDDDIKHKLKEHPQIKEDDYLLWAAMEAYKLYCKEHHADIIKTNIRYYCLSLIPIMLQIITSDLF